MSALDGAGALTDAQVESNLATKKAAVATALKPWDKFATPAAGTTGFRCEQDDPAAEKPVRPVDNCKDIVDAETKKITKRGCCSAAIPHTEVAEDLKWELTTAGRIEVCVVSADAEPAKTWEPVEFVPILKAKYSVMCIEGAMKAAAGAAAVMGSIFMMQ